MKKILFIQLPLIDHSYSYIQGNVEYAPASIAAFLRYTCSTAEASVTEYLPSIISNFGSNNTVISYIVKTKPDIVAFTSYLWNVERNLVIARSVSRALPDTKIIFGGPEIHRSSWALTSRHSYVDLFVMGEGEWFFPGYLSGADFSDTCEMIHGNSYIHQPEKDIIPAECIVEPFTNNMLNSMADGSTFVELTRGCPYRCSYCFYSKNSSRVRELPFDILLKAISMSNRHTISEIYILSPTFDRSPDFIKNLRTLCELNHGIRLHTEIRAENINPETAALMKRAGFTSLEIGLQTLTPGALTAVGRKSNPEKELAGIKALHKAGIDLKIGIIPGLPGDSPDKFITTVDRLVAEGLEECIEFYPLMVLPGTRIREQALREGAVFQERPPYLLLDGWGFDFDTLRGISSYVDEQTGAASSFSSLPDFTVTSSGIFTNSAMFDGSIPGHWNGERYAASIDTNIFSFFIVLKNAKALNAGLPMLFDNLPEKDQLYNIIMFTDTVLSEKVLHTFTALYQKDSLYSRLHIFEDWSSGLHHHWYQVFDSADHYWKAHDAYELITPVLRLTDDSWNRIQEGHLLPVKILVGKGMFSVAGDFLVREYGDTIEDIAFESKEEQRRFFTETGNEFTESAEFRTLQQ